MINKQDLKSELGVEIVDRTLEGLGYTMAHTKEKYSPYDLMVTKVTDQKSELPNGGFLGEHYGRPFFLFIVDELHDGVFAINISEKVPDTKPFSNTDTSLRKKFSMGQSIKLRSLNFDEKRKLKKYRTIHDGNEQYYNDKTLKTSQAIWNINTKNRAK